MGHGLYHASVYTGGMSTTAPGGRRIPESECSLIVDWDATPSAPFWLYPGRPGITFVLSTGPARFVISGVPSTFSAFMFAGYLPPLAGQEPNGLTLPP